MADIKVLRKLAIKIEGTPGTYEEPDILLPFTSATPGRSYNMIPDESIVGEAHRDLPLQGVRVQEFSVEGQVDVLTVDNLLEAAFGAESSLVYTLPTTVNEKSLTLFALTDVSSLIYAGCYIKTLEIASEKEGDVNFKADIVGYTLETRDATAFPTMNVTPGTRLQHRHAGGTGYIRIANQDDALGSGDNIGLDSWRIVINNQFESQFDNTSQGTLIPLSSAAGRQEVSFEFVVSRYSADTLLAARDAATAMQAEIYLYGGAAATLKLQMPNFIIEKSDVTEDNIPMIDCSGSLCRNGISTSYSNSNMSFNSPVRATLVNS